MLAEAPASFQPILQRLRDDPRTYFDAVSAAIEPVEHSHREYSDLLRIRVALPHRAVDAFVKILRPVASTGSAHALMSQRVAASFDSAVALAQIGPDSGAVAKTVRPIACFPDLFAIVTERAAGV